MEFATTPGGTCAYSKYLFAVPIAVTINNSTRNLDFLDTHEWLKHPSNRVLLRSFLPSSTSSKLSTCFTANAVPGSMCRKKDGVRVSATVEGLACTVSCPREPESRNFRRVQRSSTGGLVVLDGMGWERKKEPQTAYNFKTGYKILRRPGRISHLSVLRYSARCLKTKKVQ